MKVKVLFVLLFASAISAFAQPLQSVKKAKEHFAQNIQNLDAIEGVYNVENTVKVYSRYGGVETVKQNFVCAILKGSEDFFFVHSMEGDVKGLIGGIEKLGGSYNYCFEKISSDKNSTKILFQLTDLFSFVIQEERSNRSAVSKVTTLFVKTYPNATAIKERIEIESTPTEWSGTGFALKDNYIVTNYHVVEDAKTISVQGINGDFNAKYNASVVASDKINDLAILKIEGVNVSTNDIPYSVKTSTSEVGEDVFVLGYPLTSTMGEEIKLTTGVVSSKTGFQGDVSLYQISAPIQPGNSGGPLFDGNGNIIGIVSAKHEKAENVSYAVKASYLRNLMESVVSENILPLTNKIANYKLSDKVKLLKNYVYYITCSSAYSANNN